MVYVDHGPADGRPVLMMHGNPTWSFLWRKVIGALGPSSGLRVIAPDLFGFGASSKLGSPGEHQLTVHVEAVAALLEELEIESPVLCGQDWGGPIACGVGVRRGASALVLGNTGVLAPARPFRSKTFHRFSHLPWLSDVAFRAALFPLPVLRWVQGDRSSIGLFESCAYTWPFLLPGARAGALGLARMVPNSEAHPSTATLDEIGAWVGAFDGPSALVWGRRDPILGRGLRRHRAALPEASVRECDAGHFSQEEVPELWAAAIREVCRRAEA